MQRANQILLSRFLRKLLTSDNIIFSSVSFLLLNTTINFDHLNNRRTSGKKLMISHPKGRSLSRLFFEQISQTVIFGGSSMIYIEKNRRFRVGPGISKMSSVFLARFFAFCFLSHFLSFVFRCLFFFSFFSVFWFCLLF
jgi:hypothetical protein